MKGTNKANDTSPQPVPTPRTPVGTKSPSTRSLDSGLSNRPAAREASHLPMVQLWAEICRFVQSVNIPIVIAAADVNTEMESAPSETLSDETIESIVNSVCGPRKLRIRKTVERPSQFRTQRKQDIRRKEVYESSARSEFTETLAIHVGLKNALKAKKYSKIPAVQKAAEKLYQELAGERSIYGRQLSMIKLMKKGASIESLGRKLRCSRRTVFRYLNHLEDAGVSIKLEDGKYHFEKIVRHETKMPIVP